MGEKILALTLDDGPSPDTMPRVLDVLARYGAKATFFLWGEQITPELLPLLRKTLDQGHELGNHSMHHLHMADLTVAEIRQETESLQQLLQEQLGVTPVWFRAPYLETSPEMLETVPMPFAAGYGNRDWLPETDAAERLALAREVSRDGNILLMHCFSGNEATVEALEQLLPWLAEQGIAVTTLSDLFARKGITPEAGKVYDFVS